MLGSLIVIATLGLVGPSSLVPAVGGPAARQTSEQDPVTDSSPAQREWEQLVGRITPKLVEFQSLPPDRRSGLSFQQELADLGAFFRKYRESEPDFAWTARIFMAKEILAGVLERPAQAVQVLRETTRKAPDGLLAGVAAIHAGRLLLQAGDQAGLVQLRSLYAARKDREPGFQEALEDLVTQVALRPGQPFPALGIRDLEGGTLRIDQLQGKVVLLLVFNVVHDASRQELRRAAELDGRLRPSGLSVVGISLDDDRERLLEALQEDGIEFPVGFDGMGWDSPAARTLGVNRLPMTFVLGPAGIIRHAHVHGVELAPLIEATLERVEQERREQEDDDGR